MNFETKAIDPKTILVSLHGELNTESSKQFTIDIQPLMNETEKNIVLDFADLSFISSAGLRCLLLLNKAIKSHQGKVSIKNVSEEIMQIFKLTGFDRLFEIL